MDSPTGSDARGTRPPGERAEWTELTSLPFGATRDEPDPWSWLAEEPTPVAPRDLSTAHVTAVLVAFDAARWLPETLDGLTALEHRPQRLVAIDNGSTDGTAALLRDALEHGELDAVYTGTRGTGFGDAVRAALRQDRDALGPAPTPDAPAPDTAPASDAPTQDAAAGGEPSSRWLWLLHDDAVPAPDALRRLLEHVLAAPRTGSDRIDITGPKLLLPQRRLVGSPLSEVGVTISGTGRRELMLDAGEIDQGQRDLPQPRLGVSTCGMLLRTAVWNDLDGLDPALPVFRDGVELGWRAHLNGYRVVTTPAAELVHRQVGRAGLRPRGVTGRHPARLDRRLGLLVVAGHAPARLLPLVWLRLVWSCLVRAVGYLFGKVPGRSLDELVALASFVAHPGRLRALRRRTAAIDPLPGTAEVVASLRPRWWSSLQLAGDVASAVLADRYRSVAGESEGASLDELTGDDFSSVADERPRHPWLSPVVLALVATVLGSLVAARGLYGTGALTAPALLSAPARLGELWASVWDGIPGGPGQSSPPWLAFSALASTVLAGRPEWFVTLAVCAVVPLSLLTGYPVLRRVVGDRRLRLWAALGYALLPVLLGGSNQGRLSLSVVAVLLPLLVTAVRAIALRRVRTPEAWRGGWGAGVLLTVLVSFEPSLMALALVAGLVGAGVLHRSPRKVGRIGLALGLPLVLLLPWWPSLILAPGRAFVGPDAALLGAPDAPPVWALLVGRDTGAGLPPLSLGVVVFGVIWLVALGGLARRGTRPLVLAAWSTALLALAAAVVFSRLVVAVPPLGTDVRPWVGPYLQIGFGALLLAGAVGTDGLVRDLGRRSFSWLQPVAVLGGVVLGLVTLAAGSWWVWAGAAGPVERSAVTALPPYVRNAMTEATRTRVLALDLSAGPARYAVLAGDGLRLGDADRGGTFGGSADAAGQARDLVVRLVAGTADSDLGPQLRDLGIGYVWARGLDDEERARIDNTPGLGAASSTDVDVIWQLEPAVSRSAVQDGDGRTALSPTPTDLPAGADGRLLLTGEAADPRWRASLDGVELTPVDAGWQQAFALPATGGALAWRLPAATHWFLPVQGLLFAVALVIAAPAVRRPEVRDPERAARRAATLVEVG